MMAILVASVSKYNNKKMKRTKLMRMKRKKK
jgi:hypothetical protein